MSTGNQQTTREERLAARLRENLHRRKAQERARGRTAAEQADAGGPGSSLPKRGDDS